PHRPAPQPNLVPVSFKPSRITHRSGVAGGASVVTCRLLTVNLIAIAKPHCAQSCGSVCLWPPFEQEAEAEAKAAVEDDLHDHAADVPAGGHRLPAKREDDEPEHENRADGAEQEARHVVHRSLGEAAFDRAEHDAPNATPECERPDLRHAQRFRWRVAE